MHFLIIIKRVFDVGIPLEVDPNDGPRGTVPMDRVRGKPALMRTYKDQNEVFLKKHPPVSCWLVVSTTALVNLVYLSYFIYNKFLCTPKALCLLMGDTYSVFG